MRQTLGPVTFAIVFAITACGGGDGTDDVATDATGRAVEVSDEPSLCAELFAPGQTTDEVLAAVGMDTVENMQTGGECADEQGEVSVHLLSHGTCPSGARYWSLSQYGYGVAGGTWQPYPEGTRPPPTDC